MLHLHLPDRTCTIAELCLQLCRHSLLIHRIDCQLQPQPLAHHYVIRDRRFGRSFAGPLLEGLAEHEELNLIVDGQDTGTGDTTKDVGTCTLEE